ncbi:MAG: amidohydrolase family protein [Armatimonadota bacterium]|nr:amidohydrolase family protein [Armatimonadota bacterium]
MDRWRSKMPDIIDSHVHARGMDAEASLQAIREATGIDRMGLVAIQDPEAGAGLPAALQVKARHPERFFVFGGLNHARQLSDGQVAAPGLAEQAEILAEMGCDGIKMIEGKPTSRQRMDIPVTDPYFAEYWARVEELGTPIVWHVNDPEEFWDPDAIPGWAKERNWGYGPEDVQKEELYAEVDEVLGRHPALKIIFAHFYFLSADLQRAGRFLGDHPTVCFDLAPGVEMLYNISRDPDAGREFFTRHADRNVFGTDLSTGLSTPEAKARAGIVFRWLESDDEFRVPPEADFLLGPPEDGVIRGMSLPDEVLVKIYGGNFMRLVGATPRPLDIERAAAHCQHLADIAEAMSGTAAEETEAGRVARGLAEM